MQAKDAFQVRSCNSCGNQFDALYLLCSLKWIGSQCQTLILQKHDFLTLEVRAEVAEAYVFMYCMWYACMHTCLMTRFDSVQPQ